MKIPPSLTTDILILGGGLTGLSTAFHLEKAGKTDYLLVEKNNFLGGLCASQQKGNFIFDYSGHLLHLHNPYTLKLVRYLLKGNLAKIKRKAYISIEKELIPFPFQANLWALPQNIRQECLKGALEVSKKKFSIPSNFEKWCLQAFGNGIYKHFMRPYNQKLWQTSPAKMTCDWCGSFVVQTNLQQVLAGAEKPPRQQFGYNSYFYYPKEGGCGALAEALSKRIPNIWLNAEVQQINLHKKEAIINGKKIHFKRLVNTLPLKEAVRLMQAPFSIKTAAKQLKNTSVYVYNFAINRPVPDMHWIYFPQEDIPFYRVGIQSNFSVKNAPKGTSSFYVETAEKITDFRQAEKAFLKALTQKGIINKQDKVILSFWQQLPTAYAIYDKNRASCTKKILHWLEKNNCFCAGRYGLWEYSFMERSLLQGQDLAKKLTL